MSIRSVLRTCSIRSFTTNTFNVYDARHDKLEAIVKKALYNSHPYTDREAFLRKAHLASHALPESLRSMLYQFKQKGNDAGFVLVRNLPTDRFLMDTPVDVREVPHKKQTFHSEFWLSSVGSLLGDPFSFVQENYGNLFHNVRPKKGEEENLSSESSKVLLDLHSETAFHPFYPDYLQLFCLRGDRNKHAKTIVSSIRSVINAIPPHIDALLRQPLFKTGVDYSFGSVNGTKGNGPTIPILYGKKSDPLMIFDPDLMMGLTDQATEAITLLKALLDAKKAEVLLEEGDLLIVDNNRAVHGRNAFKAYYDGQDRWLQRIYITRNLLRAQFLFGKDERIISYTFR